MKKPILIVPALLLVAAVVWALARRTTPPEVPVTAVKKERLVSNLVTNGKAEPVDWAAVHAETAGAVRAVHVRRGQQVSKGALLVELDVAPAQARLAAAEARIEGVRAEIETLERGGRSTDLAEIESEIRKARLDLQLAERESQTLERLAAKNAATRQEAAEARDRAEKIRLQIQALERRRGALVSPADQAAAGARLKDAQAAARSAREAIEQSRIRAPQAGTVFDLPVRPGAYLNPGDLIAEIGRLERLRVRVYVDEPELGRVGAGMPVTITWDALPGREWSGRIESVPTEIQSLGTRQVGEVIAIIDNPKGELIPGTNIDASIQSRVSEQALVIPREALRREDGQAGVYLVQDHKTRWQPIETGISSVTRVEVSKGLKENDMVITATDVRLRPEMQVRAVAR